MITDAKRWKGLNASNYRAAHFREMAQEIPAECDLLSTSEPILPMKRIPFLISLSPVDPAHDCSCRRTLRVLTEAASPRGRSKKFRPNSSRSRKTKPRSTRNSPPSPNLFGWRGSIQSRRKIIICALTFFPLWLHWPLVCMLSAQSNAPVVVPAAGQQYDH